MTPGSTDYSAVTAAPLPQQLVARLQDLHAGPLALPEIISMGTAAVPALEAFLRGPPQSLYHQRVLAADALAAIASDAAVAALTRALRARAYSACASALGRLGAHRAIPLLVQCLHEDAARPAAIEALRRFGAASIPRLRAALAMPYRIHGLEPPTYIAGRAAAAALLGDLDDRRSLIRALDDRECVVRIAAGLALASRIGDTVPPRAIDVLLSALDDTDWARARAIMQALIGCGRLIADPLLGLLARDTADEAAQRRRHRAVILAGKLGLAAATTPLAALSDHRDAQLRFAALQALTCIPAAKPRQLARFLADPEAAVVQRALAALSRRDSLTARHIRRWLEYTAAGKAGWRRWWQTWRLRVAAGRARRTIAPQDRV